MQYKVDITITKTLTTYFESDSPTHAVILADHELTDFADEAVWKETTIIHCKHDGDEVSLERNNIGK